MARVIDIDIVDNQASKSSFGIVLQNSKTEQSLRVTLKKVFKDSFPESSFFLSIRVKEEKKQELLTSVKELLLFGLNLLIETMGALQEEGKAEYFFEELFRFELAEGKLFILLDMEKAIPLGIEMVVMILEPILEIVDLRQIQGAFTISTDMSIKGVVGTVKRSNNYNDEEQMEKLRDETNLYRLFLTGLGIKLNIDCLKEARPTIVKELAQSMNENVHDKAVRYLIMSFIGFSGKIRFSKENTLDLLMDFLNKVDPDVPDGADLIDEVGEILYKAGWFDLVEKTPVLSNFVSTLIECGHCDINVGYSSDRATFYLNAKTEGIKELYMAVMEGVKSE